MEDVNFHKSPVFHLFVRYQGIALYQYTYIKTQIEGLYIVRLAKSIKLDMPQI